MKKLWTYVNFDVLRPTVHMLIALPFAVITTLMITLPAAARIMYHGRCNPLFFQKRVGKGGKLFWIWKLRTAIDGVEIPVVGFDYRQRRVDEWLQLWNVVFWRQALVGVRAKAEEFVQKHRPMFVDFGYNERNRHRPGLAGKAQCEGLAHVLEGNLGALIADLEFNKELERNGWIRTDTKYLVATARMMLKGAPNLKVTPIQPMAVVHEPEAELVA